jgi:hypothetical protein
MVRRRQRQHWTLTRAHAACSPLSHQRRCGLPRRVFVHAPSCTGTITCTRSVHSCALATCVVPETAVVIYFSVCSVCAEQRKQNRLPGELLSAQHRRCVQECCGHRGRDVQRQWGILVLPGRLLLARSHRQRLLQHQRPRRCQLLRADAVRRCGPIPCALLRTRNVLAGLQGGSLLKWMRVNA